MSLPDLKSPGKQSAPANTVRAAHLSHLEVPQRRLQMWGSEHVKEPEGSWTSNLLLFSSVTQLSLFKAVFQTEETPEISFFLSCSFSSFNLNLKPETFLLKLKLHEYYWRGLRIILNGVFQPILENWEMSGHMGTSGLVCTVCYILYIYHDSFTLCRKVQL